MKKELVKKNKVELVKEMNEKFITLRDLRFGVAGSNNKNVKAYVNVKKEIARIKTTLKIK